MKRAQQAAATLLSKWHAAAGKEIARRQEEESTRKWMGPIMGVWIGYVERRREERTMARDAGEEAGGDGEDDHQGTERHKREGRVERYK